MFLSVDVRLCVSDISLQYLNLQQAIEFDPIVRSCPELVPVFDRNIRVGIPGDSTRGSDKMKENIREFMSGASDILDATYSRRTRRCNPFRNRSLGIFPLQSSDLIVDVLTEKRIQQSHVNLVNQIRGRRPNIRKRI